MKKLLIVRHAKSDWSLNLDDFERTLTARGINDAKLVSEMSRDLIPTNVSIYSSSAVRARETCIIFAKTYNFPLEKIVLNNALYTFGESKLEAEIRNLPDSQNTVMIFGHNEGITDFVNSFGNIAIDNVPTSGFVALEFTSDSWSTITKGKTTKTIFPRELR